MTLMAAILSHKRVKDLHLMILSLSSVVVWAVFTLWRKGLGWPYEAGMAISSYRQHTVEWCLYADMLLLTYIKENGHGNWPVRSDRLLCPANKWVNIWIANKEMSRWAHSVIVSGMDHIALWFMNRSSTTLNELASKFLYPGHLRMLWYIPPVCSLSCVTQVIGWPFTFFISCNILHVFSSPQISYLIRCFQCMYWNI